MYSETCVCCGSEIPEGRQVCPICEMRYGKIKWEPEKGKITVI